MFKRVTHFLRRRREARYRWPFTQAELMAMRKGITSREAEQRRFDEARVASFFGVPESMGIRPRSRVDDAVTALGMAQAYEDLVIASLTGFPVESIKVVPGSLRIDGHAVTGSALYEQPPGHIGLDLSIGPDLSAAWKRRADGSLELLSFAPVWPVPAPAILDASIQRLNDRVERMRFHTMDCVRPGFGRNALFWRMTTAYGARQEAFGETWKVKAANYARLQAIHLDLYGATVPVAALRGELAIVAHWRAENIQTSTFTPEDFA